MARDLYVGHGETMILRLADIRDKMQNDVDLSNEEKDFLHCKFNASLPSAIKEAIQCIDLRIMQYEKAVEHRESGGRD